MFCSNAPQFIYFHVDIRLVVFILVYFVIVVNIYLIYLHVFFFHLCLVYGKGCGRNVYWRKRLIYEIDLFVV